MDSGKLCKLWKIFALVYKTLIKKLMYLLAGLSALKNVLILVGSGGGVEMKEETNTYITAERSWYSMVSLCENIIKVHVM